MEAMRLPFATRLAFALLVVAEIAIIVLAAQWLGGWPVFWLIVATGLVGGWAVRREGIRAWSAVAEAVRAGRLPEHDMATSGLVVIGGFLLILPGFVTDLLGALLILPPTRSMMRRMMTRLLPPGLAVGARVARWRPRQPGDAAPQPGPVVEGEVIEGEVVDGEVAHRDEPDDESR